MKKTRSFVSILLAWTMISSLLATTGCKKEQASVSTSLSSSEPVEQTTTRATTKPTTVETTEVETSSVPREYSSIKTDWSNYGPPQEYAKPVYTRLSENYITEFQPSSEYGAIFPYLGASNRTHKSSSQMIVKYGFFDRNGQIICDPIFNEIKQVNGGYLLYQYPGTGDGQQDVNVGYVTHDGSFFTGMSYDRTQYDAQTGQLLLIAYTDTGFSVTPFDTITASYGESYTLLVPFEQFDVERTFDDIHFDRYISLYDWDDGNKVCDGATGKSIQELLHLDHLDDRGLSICGHCFYTSDAVYNENLQKVLEIDKSQLDSLPNGRAWLCEDGQVTIFDTSGNIEVQTNMERPEQVGAYFVDYRDHSLVVYDEHLTELYMIPCDQTPYAFEPPKDESFYFELAPLLQTEERIINVQTQASFELEKGNDYSIKEIPNGLLLNITRNETERAWILLNSSDLSILSQGDGYASVRYDYLLRKVYLCVSNKPSNMISGKIIDASTGETFLTLQPLEDVTKYGMVSSICDHLIIREQMNLSNYVSDGWTDEFDPRYTHSKKHITFMQDQDGQTLFLYRAVEDFDD